MNEKKERTNRNSQTTTIPTAHQLTTDQLQTGRKMWQAFNDLTDLVAPVEEETAVAVGSEAGSGSVSGGGKNGGGSGGGSVDENVNENSNKGIAMERGDSESGDDDEHEHSYDDTRTIEMTPEESEAERRCELVETFTEPLLLDNDVADDDYNSQSDRTDCNEQKNNEIDTSSENAKDPVPPKECEGGNNIGSRDSSDKKIREIDIEEASSGDSSIDEEEMELKEIQHFLETFDIEAHTEEISQLLRTPSLEENAPSSNDSMDDIHASVTPLQYNFQTLVPTTVSYTDFWTRYYYRCDPHRIAHQWKRREQIEELLQTKRRRERERKLAEVQREVADAAQTAVDLTKSAASMLKGGLAWSRDVATEAVEDVVEQAGEVVYVLRGKQSMGRPPFVMGVTDDGDDDSYYEDEEEIDLEMEDGALDVFYEDDNNAEDGTSTGGYEEDEGDEDAGEEEVNFQDVSILADNESLDVVKLRQSLIHAEDQRNVMMGMVEERQEEINKLRSALEHHRSANTVDNSGASDTEVNGLKMEVEWLKLLVNATRQDFHNDNSKQCEQIIDGLKSIVNRMRFQAIRCKRQNMERDNCSPSRRESCEAIIKDLQSEIQVLKSKVSKVDARTTEIINQQEELEEMKNECKQLQAESEETKRSITLWEERLRQIREEQQ